MASVYSVFTPSIIAQESLMVLENEMIMGRLVHRDFENEIAKYGDTVNTRMPGMLTVKDWGGQNASDGLADKEIEVEVPTATNVAVKLDKLKYTSFMEEDLPATVAVKNIAAEFVRPAISPIAAQMDDDVIDEFIAGEDYAGATISRVNIVGTAAAAEDVIALRKALNVSKCPAVGRILVVGTDHEADLLKDATFNSAATSGSTEALVNANLARKFGFDIFMSQQVYNDTTSAAKGQSLAFHKNALALVVRPLRQVQAGMGAVCSVQSYNGLSVRITTAYNNRGNGVDYKFDTLYGVQLLMAALAKRLVG